MGMREKLNRLLRDYSLEQILEIGEVEEIDALEYLVQCGALDLDEIIEAVD
jgi:hypothetical protein